MKEVLEEIRRFFHDRNARSPGHNHHHRKRAAKQHSLSVNVLEIGWQLPVPTAFHQPLSLSVIAPCARADELFHSPEPTTRHPDWSPAV
jgi:hypothetical protein